MKCYSYLFLFISLCAGSTGVARAAEATDLGKLNEQAIQSAPQAPKSGFSASQGVTSEHVAIVLDLILLLLILLGGYQGFKKGFISQLFATFVFCVLIALATRFFERIAAFVKVYVPDLEGIWPFVVLFIVVLAGMLLLNKLLGRILEFTFLGYMNHVLGAFMGALQTAICISVVIWLMESYELALPGKYTDHMHLYHELRNLAPGCLDLIKRHLPVHHQ